ncbi:phosphonate ABC transporter ATP-binding protein [Alkalicoccus saliphilus]|uniref:Phosphonate ABC transporter ATP-binding protein n=1 Tax=Alkalicoccus saliphilus TaxID=200989 RepID=A0A2T4U9X3_9BACI|nr:phosphonate ABC transporter ATP-binding protein [Alkalicoccus saliphilus]PTL40195.1 phosphonate ABC transporter ATP-binding protein [Alkalicoccus saliphilus]
MLSFKNVSVVYEKGEAPALNNINLEIKPEEFVCVLGRSGAGKSTFIRTVNGLQTPTDGRVTVLGNELNCLKEKRLRKLRSEIGMIFQHFHLIPRMSVEQNVYTGRFGQRPVWKNMLGLFSEEEKRLTDSYLREVGLYEFRGRRVERLSGGQKQRVGIARAMVQEPSILLGDEPVASLDPTTSDHIFQLLKSLHLKRKLTTVINVHDIELAEKFATRIIGLQNGEIVFNGTPSEMTKTDLQHIYK